MTGLVSNVFAEVKLKTEAQVAAYADSITGFNNIKGIAKSFKQVVITDDNTPFLHKQINGRNVWVAEYKNFKLELKSVPNGDKYKRNFKIYIDANDGTLLKITSKFDVFDPNLPKEPNAVIAERQLKGESYIGFPKEPPKINFLDALDDAQMGSPLQAKEIDALYVWYSDKYHQPMRVWIISTRGQPPIPIRGDPISKEEVKEMENNLKSSKGYFRVFIDADTGKALFGDNILRPEDPNKSKK